MMMHTGRILSAVGKSYSFIPFISEYASGSPYVARHQPEIEHPHHIIVEEWFALGSPGCLKKVFASGPVGISVHPKQQAHPDGCAIIPLKAVPELTRKVSASAFTKPSNAGVN